MSRIKNIARFVLILIGIIPVAAWGGYSQNTNDQIDLIIMSYNVRYLNNKDGVNHWDNRKEKVATVVLSNHVDIAGLQEPWKPQIRDLKQLLLGRLYLLLH